MSNPLDPSPTQTLSFNALGTPDAKIHSLTAYGRKPILQMRLVGEKMTIQERIKEDLKQSMRSRTTARTSLLRFLLSAIHNEEIVKQKELGDEAVLDVLGHQAKQRRDSIEAFKIGKRQDLVDKEESELSVVLEYLPDQLSADEIAVLAQQAIEKIGAEGPQDIGKVMGQIMPAVRGKADGKIVSTVVSGLLGDLTG